jgi:hypothetical protein
MKLIDLISYGLVLCHKLCIILMSMCFIEITINKILPVLLLKLANNLTFVRQPFFNELIIITKLF